MTRDEAIALLSGGAGPGSEAWNSYYGSGGFYNQAPSVQAAGTTPFLQQPQTLTPLMYNPGYASVSGQGYNPYQYANNNTTQILADLLGGTPVTNTYANSPFNIPSMNMIDIGGQQYNAGLLANAFSKYDPRVVAQMYGLTLNPSVASSLQQQSNAFYNGNQGNAAAQTAFPTTSGQTTPTVTSPTTTTTPTTAQSQTQTQLPYATMNRQAEAINPYTTRTSPSATPANTSGVVSRTNPVSTTPATSTLSRVGYLNDVQRRGSNALAPTGGGGTGTMDRTSMPAVRPNYSGFSRQGFNW